MVYLLFDENVYFQLNGNRQQLPRPQALRLLESHARFVLAAFLDYDVKVIPAPDGNLAQRQRLIAACFPTNDIIQAERLGPNQYMVIGADKQKVNAVYDALLPLKVEQLVPYGMGLRAYLNDQGLLDADGISICVDDQKTQAIISICEGNRFSAPRRISITNDAQLLTEVKRSLQAHLSDNPASREKQVKVLINQANWQDLFNDQFTPEQVKVFSSLCACLDGLVLAKFAMHFRSLEEILRQKRRQVTVNRIKAFMAGALIILVGLSTYALAWGYERSQTQELYKAKARLEDAQERLRNMYVQKIFALLQKGGAVNYGVLYYEFYRRVPSGYVIKDWSIVNQGDGRWVFKASLYPQSAHVASGSFRLSGLFQQAKIEAAMVNKVLGQVITLSF